MKGKILHLMTLIKLQGGKGRESTAESVLRDLPDKLKGTKNFETLGRVSSMGQLEITMYLQTESIKSMLRN